MHCHVGARAECDGDAVIDEAGGYGVGGRGQSWRMVNLTNRKITGPRSTIRCRPFFPDARKEKVVSKDICKN